MNSTIKMHPSHHRNLSLTKTSKLTHIQTQGNKTGKTSECKKCDSACDTTALRTYINTEVKKSKMGPNKTGIESTEHKVRSDSCVRLSDCNKRDHKLSDRTVCNSKCQDQNSKLASAADKKGFDAAASKVKKQKKVWNAGASNGAKHKSVLDTSVGKVKAQKAAGKSTEHVKEEEPPADKKAEHGLLRRHTGNIHLVCLGKTLKVVTIADTAEVSEDTESKTAQASVVSDSKALCEEVSKGSETKLVLTAETSRNTSFETVHSEAATEGAVPNSVSDDDVDSQETDHYTTAASEGEMLTYEQALKASESGDELDKHPAPPDNHKPERSFLKEAITLTRIHMMCTHIKLSIKDLESKKRVLSRLEKDAPMFNYSNVPPQYVPRLLASRRRVRFTRQGELVPAQAGCDDSSFETFDEMLEVQKMDARQDKEMQRKEARQDKEMLEMQKTDARQDTEMLEVQRMDARQDKEMLEVQKMDAGQEGENTMA